MTTAWYLGHGAADVGESAILVGDPNRVGRIATGLGDPVFLPEKRGLRTVTGTFADRRVTIAAFGMGAPIAAIVMHELADLGVRRFLRIGTAMYFPPAGPGQFLISRDAIAFDGTSPAYRTDDAPLTADVGLVDRLHAAVARAGVPAAVGTFATFDAFYRDMFALDRAAAERVAATRARLQRQTVLATDMETSALLAVGQSLGVEAATLCVGTVDGISQEKISAGNMARLEPQLFAIALDALTSAPSNP